MKCPKCEYLGFETSDRCKNCGYDFSLVALDALDSLDITAAIENSAARDAAAARRESTPLNFPAFDLPLFTPSAAGAGDDEPLIRVPASPRPPLAVRRTPETPRLRAAAKAVRQPEPALELDFVEESAAPAAARERERRPLAYAASGGGRRLAAAAVDLAILLGIDLAVVYFTLKMAALTLADWQAVPVVPLAVFLLMVKAAYVIAFTAVGGQTIGKMAAGIRVVGDDDRTLDLPRATRRALASSLSVVTFGLAFIPALVAADRRALHDRLAGTRVVAIPVA